jgi:hypothetical protein
MVLSIIFTAADILDAHNAYPFFPKCIMLAHAATTALEFREPVIVGVA